MKYLLGVLIIGLIGIACMGACATSLGVWKEDVTHDPHFQGGYEAGQVYRLKSDGAIMLSAPGTPDECKNLWPQDNALRAYNPTGQPGINYTPLAAAPAGSLVRINRLEFADDVYFLEDFAFAAPIHPHRELRAWGTVTDATGATDEVIVTPMRFPPDVVGHAPAPWWSSQGPISITRPDDRFLQIVPPPTQPAAANSEKDKSTKDTK